jgi:hypothetical protein
MNGGTPPACTNTNNGGERGPHMALLFMKEMSWEVLLSLLYYFSLLTNNGERASYVLYYFSLLTNNGERASYVLY